MVVFLTWNKQKAKFQQKYQSYFQKWDMLVQPSGEMRTDSLISLKTVSKMLSAALTGGVAWVKYNRLWWRDITLKYIFI